MYSTKIVTMSIFICVIPVVEETCHIDDDEAASLKINIRHQRFHERHQPGANGRLDLQDILRWQVQHRSHLADLSAVGGGGAQSDQLPVVELTSLCRLLIGLDGSNQQCAARSLGAGSVDKLGKPHQQPPGVIANRSHREEAVAAFLPKYLTGDKSTLRLISAEFHRNLAMYAVRSSDDTNDGVRVQLLAPLAADRARNPPTSSSLADQKRVRSLRVCCSLRSLRPALVSRCLPRSLADGKACLLARSSRTASRQPLSTAARVFTSSLRWLLLGGRSAATATGTATSESVNVDEIDAYVLIAGQRPDYGTQSSCGAT